MKKSRKLFAYMEQTINIKIFLCAIPLCHQKFLKGLEYVVDFSEKDSVKISVGDVLLIIDFANKKCAINKDIKCYGSDSWGQDVQANWGEI